MMQTKACEQCGRVFDRTANMTRWATMRFCSKACSAASRRIAEPPPRTCAQCTAMLVRKPNEQNHAWRTRVYCSPQCVWAAKVKAPVTDQDGRRAARRAFPMQPCEVCGGEAEGRHHRDSNRLNNDVSNIAFLCRQHHKDAHDLTDQQVGGGARPRIAAAERDAAIAKARHALELIADGMTQEEAAAALGTHRVSMLRWFRKYSADL